MFTGIIEEIGKVNYIKTTGNSAILSIECEKVLKNTKIGDSIAVNGICLTVTKINENSYETDVMPETMKRSSLRNLRKNDYVNLERAMLVNSRFGGHIVSGHVDGIGTIENIQKDENAVWYTISTSKDMTRYIVEKGSVAIEGISLTIAEVDTDRFKVSIIPHTNQETNLRYKNIKDTVNIECDIIGKYVEKLLCKKNESKITKEFLIENGF